MIPKKELDPKYVLDLLTDLGVFLIIQPSGELTFDCPDHIRGDVTVMLGAESFQKTLREYLGEWRPLAKCVACGVSITEQREDPACLEIRLVSDTHTLDAHGRVICGQCGQPATVGSFPS